MNPLNLIFAVVVACCAVANGNTNLPSFALKMLEFQRKLKQEIATPTIEKSSLQIPNYMLNLYRKKEGLGQNTRGRRGEMRSFSKKQSAALRTSNFIRSFKSLESRLEGSTLKIVFDLSTILQKERIKLAELQLTSFNGQVRQVEIWNKVEFLDSMRVNKDNSVINVTPVIKRWYKLNENKQSDYTGVKQTSEVVLTVFSVNKHYDLMKTLEDRKVRARRSVSGGNRQRRRGRNGKGKKGRNNKTHASHSVQYDTDSYNTNFAALGNELEDSEVSVDQSKSSQNKEEYDIISQQRESLKKQKPKQQQKKVEYSPRAKPTHCRKVAFQVDFEKIGWGSWVIFPKRYNAYRCEGSCRMPLHDNLNPTNHAYVQSLMSTSNPQSNIPEPCCVPIRYSPISILYHENGEVKQRVHEDMVVEECGCR